MTTECKAIAPFELKSTNDEARTFEGLAATWSLDSGGDVIHKGAFDRTLKNWRASEGKHVIPLIDQHNYGSTFNVLGKMTAAEETDDGLLASFQVVPGADGDGFLARLKAGLVSGLSIGYQVVGNADITQVESAVGGVKRAVRNLRELKLHEVSAVIWGMNPEALVNAASIKSALAALTDEEKQQVSALLTPAPAAPRALAPEATQALAERLRSLKLRCLATGSGRPARA